MTETNATTELAGWDLGDPVWWCPAAGERYSGTVLRHTVQSYLVTLHDHPEWRWVEQVPAGQLVNRDETPELVVHTVNGVDITTWTCPHPSHKYSKISTQSSRAEWARRACARYMPPLGHRHDTPLPPDLLPEGVDPASVPVWSGGFAPQSGGAQ